MKNSIITFFMLLALIPISCVEPYKLESIGYQETLVVESTITDEFTHQQIKLMIASKLEANSVLLLSGAQVWVGDSNGNNYTFTESEEGIYSSDHEFKAMPNIEYKLNIKTPNGKQYESRGERLTPEVPISNIYTEVITIDGKQGVQVYVDSDNVNESAKYFRYEFDETYKVAMPYEITKRLILTNVSVYPLLRFDIEIEELEENIHTCYTTEKNKQINLTNISNFSENNIHKHPIRFINDYDRRIAERYSILVKQYTQTYDAYSFYKTLDMLGGFDNVFEETQSGFVEGNMFSKEDLSEKVVGFFDVSSISSSRIFFYYADFEFPPFYQDPLCTMQVLDYNDMEDRKLLYNYFNNPEYSWNYYVDYFSPQPPLYQVVQPTCGNCTLLSSNIKPEFWID